jgi:hypothetical protein
LAGILPPWDISRSAITGSSLNLEVVTGMGFSRTPAGRGFSSVPA